MCSVSGVVRRGAWGTSAVAGTSAVEASFRGELGLEARLCKERWRYRVRTRGKRGDGGGGGRAAAAAAVAAAVVVTAAVAVAVATAAAAVVAVTAAVAVALAVAVPVAVAVAMAAAAVAAVAVAYQSPLDARLKKDGRTQGRLDLVEHADLTREDKVVAVTFVALSEEH